MFHMKLEGLLWCQCPVTGPHPEPIESSSQPSIAFPLRSSVVLFSHLCLNPPNGLLLSEDAPGNYAVRNFTYCYRECMY